MSQLRLYFDIHASQAIKVSNKLESLFEEDGYPVANFESDEEKAIWTISVYLDETEMDLAKTKIEKTLLEFELDCQILCEKLEDRDWVTETLKGLAPVHAGRFIVHGSHDAGCAKSHHHAILIDAAQAFGTGHHGTTAGCLDMIGKAMKQHQFANALDLGTGTGVLAIAIAKAANIPVLATDIDPISAHTAHENAKINGVACNIHSIAAAGFQHPAFSANGPFDLVVANILARPLQMLAPDLVRHTAPGGTVILSGLLSHQKAPIIAAYRIQGMHFQHAHYRDGWMTLTFKNP